MALKSNLGQMALGKLRCWADLQTLFFCLVPSCFDQEAMQTLLKKYTFPKAKIGFLKQSTERRQKSIVAQLAFIKVVTRRGPDALFSLFEPHQFGQAAQQDFIESLCAQIH